MFNSDTGFAYSSVAGRSTSSRCAQEIAQNAALASQHSSDDAAWPRRQQVDKTIAAMQQLSANISDSCAISRR